MRHRAFACGVLVLAMAASAIAGEMDVMLFGAAAYPTHDETGIFEFADGDETLGSNLVRSEAENPSAAYGVGFRWLGGAGFGLELLAERTTIDLDTTTTFQMADDAWHLRGDGELEATPISANFVGQARFVDSVMGAISFGVSWIDLAYDETIWLGVPVVGNDAGDAAIVPMMMTGDDGGWSWNAGGRLDFELSRHWTVALDVRYYDGFDLDTDVKVPAATYATVGSGTLELDSADADALADDLEYAAGRPELDTRYTRVAVGLNLRF